MNSNIYEFNAASQFKKYADNLEGTPNCTLLAIASVKPSPEAQDAISKSAARLGYGLDAVAWLTFRVADAKLSESALQEIAEGIDPIAVICLDSEAASAFVLAYGNDDRCEVEPQEIDKLLRATGYADFYASLRRVIAFADFNGMLANEDGKQRAWAVLKKLTR